MKTVAVFLGLLSIPAGIIWMIICFPIGLLILSGLFITWLLVFATWSLAKDLTSP